MHQPVQRVYRQRLASNRQRAFLMLAQATHQISQCAFMNEAPCQALWNELSSLRWLRHMLVVFIRAHHAWAGQTHWPREAKGRLTKLEAILLFLLADVISQNAAARRVYHGQRQVMHEW